MKDPASYVFNTLSLLASFIQLKNMFQEQLDSSPIPIPSLEFQNYDPLPWEFNAYRL